MRRFGSYALIATYLVVQLFGQVLHAWSGCEHAHLPGQWSSQATVAIADGHAEGHHHHHDHSSHSHGSAERESAPIEGDGWKSGHRHNLAIDGCLLCQHLALGQIAPATTPVAVESIAVESFIPRSTRFATHKWLGPNSPRAPPTA